MGNFETVTLKCLTIAMMDINGELFVSDIKRKDILSRNVQAASTLHIAWLQEYKKCREIYVVLIRKEQNWYST